MTFTKIKGLSDARRMPRLEKIRLGAKIEKITNAGKPNQKSVEFPVELPFFLLPPSVAVVHGMKDGKKAELRAKEIGATRQDVLKFIKENYHRLAEELPVMIPVEETEHSFPQAYKMYGGSIGLKCVGDGENAQERVGITSEFQDKKCPCNQLKTDTNPRGACSIVANLQVMLPEVSAGGVFQIDIGSINSIIDINSGIDYIRSIVGRIAMIPMKLKRIPIETHHGGKKQIHFTCQLTFEGNIHAIADMRESKKILTHSQVLQLDAPDTSDPKMDKPDATYQQSAAVTKMVDELNQLRTDGKLTKLDAEAIRESIDACDDQSIIEIHRVIMARIPTGTTAADITKKLKNKNPVQGKEEPPTPDGKPVEGKPSQF